MKKVILKRKRPKAFIGAIIGAVGSIASGVIGGVQAKKAAKAEAAAQELANKKQEAANLTQSYANDFERSKDFQDKFKIEYKSGGSIKIKGNKSKMFKPAASSKGLSNISERSQLKPKQSNMSNNTIVHNPDKVSKKRLNPLDIDLDVDRIEYAKGGKRKCSNGGVEPVISNGGSGIDVGNSLTLLRGRKHKTGGIVIGKGNNSIEAESGEVIKREKDTLKIFSAEPILNGESPAKKVLRNPIKANKVFQEQESYKDRNNLNDDGTKKYKSLTNGRKAKMGLKDKLSIGADVVGGLSPIVSGIFGINAINKTKAPPAPSQYSAAKLKTNYNINPQLANVERSRQQVSSDIDRNTASSAAALARKQRISTDSLMQRNQLFGQKENIETELINRDLLNKQQVSAQNVAQNNEYEYRKNQFNTEKRLAKANVASQMIEGTVGAVRDWQSRKDRKEQEDNALAAIMAKNPEQVDLFTEKHKKYKELLKTNSFRSNSFKCGGKRKVTRKK